MIHKQDWFKAAMRDAYRRAAAKGRVVIVDADPWDTFVRDVKFEEAGRRLDAQRSHWKRRKRQG